MRTLSVLFSVAFLTTACGTPESECASQDAASCIGAGCSLTYGGAVDDLFCNTQPNGLQTDFWCEDTPAETVCDDALTLGTSPSGETYLFADSCLPEGFTEESCIDNE